MKLKESFYLRSDVVAIARELLGKRLCVQSNEGILSATIVETEAYSYLEKACHAYNNRRTKRTETLFARGGLSYVYLCYGIHRLFNVVTNVEGKAEAVLIRAVEPDGNLETMRTRRGVSSDYQLTSGPGKLSEALNISLTHNGETLLGDSIWLEDGESPVAHDIVETTRIGVAYAKEDALLPWRFYNASSKFVSVR